MKEEGKSVLVCICTVAGCTTPHFLKESCFRVCCITAVNIIHFWPFGLPNLMQGCRNVCFLFVCFLLKQCWDCRQRENSNFWIFMHFMVRNSFTLHHLPVQNCTEGVKKKKNPQKNQHTFSRLWSWNWCHVARMLSPVWALWTSPLFCAEHHQLARMLLTSWSLTLQTGTIKQLKKRKNSSTTQLP